VWNWTSAAYGTGIALYATLFLFQPVFAADVARGAKLYEEQGCSGCHAAKDVLMGPPHCGVYGRKAGAAPGYDYSDAMRESGLIWDDKTLQEFLTSPFTYVPGTKMGFAGIDDEKDRNDIIAFLKKERAPDSPACR
jgi:cytochrome c